MHRDLTEKTIHVQIGATTTGIFYKGNLVAQYGKRHGQEVFFVQIGPDILSQFFETKEKAQTVIYAIVNVVYDLTEVPKAFYES